MRVMMPNGNVISVKRAITVCEERTPFNGRVERRCECAKDIIYANGIAFVPVAETLDVCDMTAGGTVFFGNLTNEFVREVLASLVEKGYVDLSGLKLQKTQLVVSHYVFDNGASEAYLLQGYEANASCARVPGYPFMGMGTVNETEDTEDVEDAGEEDCTDE